MAKPPCKFENCDNEQTYPILEICSTCYSGLRLWVGRGKAAKEKRMGQYKRMEERMNYLMVGKGLMPGYTKKKGAKPPRRAGRK